MEFCPNCDNILIPNDKKLYCRACKELFDLTNEEEYKIIKTIEHDGKEQSPIIIHDSSSKKISKQYREAFEEYFS